MHTVQEDDQGHTPRLVVAGRQADAVLPVPRMWAEVRREGSMMDITNNWPLRKIVTTTYAGTGSLELLLECGHRQQIATSERRAKSKRCPSCVIQQRREKGGYDELATDFDRTKGRSTCPVVLAHPVQ